MLRLAVLAALGVVCVPVAPSYAASEAGVAAGAEVRFASLGTPYVVGTQLEWHPNGIGYSGRAVCEVASALPATVVCEVHSDGGVSWTATNSGRGVVVAQTGWGSGEVPSRVCALVTVSGTPSTRSCTTVYVP